MFEEKYEPRVVGLNGLPEDYPILCSLLAMAAFRSRELINALTNEDGEVSVTDMAFAVLIARLHNTPLRAVQTCSMITAAWKKLQGKYTGKLFNKVSLLHKLINSRLQVDMDMKDHVDLMESQFNKLAIMWSEVEWSVRMAI